MEEYLKGKRDLARDILEKIEKGFGNEDIMDLIKVWAVEREDG